MQNISKLKLKFRIYAGKIQVNKKMMKRFTIALAYSITTLRNTIQILAAKYI